MYLNTAAKCSFAAHTRYVPSPTPGEKTEYFCNLLFALSPKNSLYGARAAETTKYQGKRGFLKHFYYIRIP